MKRILFTLAVLSILGTSCAHGHRHHGHMKKMWEKLDANNDGKISKSEFDAMHNEMFAQMDTDNDGFLTKEEMKARKRAGKCEKCSPK